MIEVNLALCFIGIPRALPKPSPVYVLMSSSRCHRILSICIVTYRPDATALATTLASLQQALNRCRYPAEIYIVDNSTEGRVEPWLSAVLVDLEVMYISGHGNVGFGRANNLVLERVGAFHLVLNPDVELDPDSLEEAVSFLEENLDCGLLAPLVFGTDGSRQFLCKRFPALLDLALRGFAPKGLRKVFRKRLERYQMMHIPDDEVYWNPPVISGCFMLFRGEVFRQLGGFDPAYFLYFEDFDISLRAQRITRVAFVPTVKIVHSGGYASRKGFWHITQFVKSAAIFYTKFGLKLV